MADALSEILKSPGAFALRTLKAFRANQGLLLAGAVAYYALLSIVPLLILVVIVLSQGALDIFPAMILVGMVGVAIAGGVMTWALGWIERRAIAWRS